MERLIFASILANWATSKTREVISCREFFRLLELWDPDARRLTLTRIQRSALIYFAQSLNSILLAFLTKKDPLIFCLLLLLILLLYFYKQIKEIRRLRLHVNEITVVYPWENNRYGGWIIKWANILLMRMS